MSQLNLIKGAAPSAPAATKVAAAADTDGRLITVDANGHVSTLANWRRSLLRNGGFWFAQRQVPGTLTTYSNVGGRALTLDGWGIGCENASVQARRVDMTTVTESGVAGRFYGEFTKITSTGKMQVQQAIESRMTQSMRGRNVRVRLKMKAVVTGAQWNIALVQLTSAGTADTIPSGAGLFVTAQGANGVDPTLGTALSYIAPTAGRTGDNCTSSTNCYQATLTTAWQRFSGVFTVPSTAQNLVLVIYSHNQVAAAAGVAIGEAMIIEGEEIPDWTHGSVPEELVRVRRFYQKSFALDTAPAQNVGVNTGEQRGIAGKATAVANAGFINFEFSPPMRAAPTVVVYNPAAANALARNITGAADMGATTITGTNERNSYTNSTGVAATAVGDLIAIHWSADGEL